MKKGLAIALGMVVFALAGASSFAKAPIIAGVPDIVIGDREDLTATLDSNWFRYPNAFNVLDYTTDVDSPADDLIFAFVEQTGTDAIGIVLEADSNRIVNQIDAADRNDPSVWGVNEITGAGGTRDYLLSFVDLVRSPAPYALPALGYPTPAGTGVDNPDTGGTVLDLPWPNTEGDDVTLSGTSRDVYIYAADDDTATGAERVSYDIMSVISRNFAFDSMVGGATSIFEDTFASGSGGASGSWVNLDAAGVLAVATSGEGNASGDVNGFLSLTAGAAAPGTAPFNQYYGRWKSRNTANSNMGVVPYTVPGVGEELVYVARFIMSHDQADVQDVPTIRLGAIQAQNLTWIESYVSAVEYPADPVGANPQIAAADQLMSYKVIWSPQENAPAFDELDSEQNALLPANTDARTYNLFFDVLDPSNVQAGTWTLRNLEVGTVPRPADTTAVAMGPFDGAAWSQAGAVGNITRAINAGALTFTDPGNAAGTAANLMNSNLYGRLTGLDWTGGTVLRASVELSCPVEADRDNFHTFRLVERIQPFGHLATEFNIVGWAGGVISQLPGQPFVPSIIADGTTTYEAYFPAQVIDDALIDDVRAIGDYDNILTRVDALNSQGNGTAVWQSGTHFTVHSLAYEVLNDSF